MAQQNRGKKANSRNVVASFDKLIWRRTPSLFESLSSGPTPPVTLSFVSVLLPMKVKLSCASNAVILSRKGCPRVPSSNDSFGSFVINVRNTRLGRLRSFASGVCREIPASVCCHSPSSSQKSRFFRKRSAPISDCGSARDAAVQPNLHAKSVFLHGD